MEKLSAKQVKEILDRNEGARLINVLAEERFRDKHIPGSINVPLARDTFLESVEQLNGGRSDKVVVYCADTDCNASAKATERLEKAGFRDVADFEGGLKEWEEAGYSLVGEAVDA